jgi:hypothetical protein
MKEKGAAQLMVEAALLWGKNQVNKFHIGLG